MAVRRVSSLGGVMASIAFLAGVIILGVFGLATVLFVLFG